MMPAMYSAISGLEAHETMLNVTANNLANIDTIGYKGESTSFDSQLSVLLSGSTSQSTSSGGTNPEQVGLGVTVASIDNQMSEGSLESTGNTLDVAINDTDGNGFLVVGSGAKNLTQTSATNDPGVVTATYTGSAISYTRAGNLTTDSEGYLTTASGQYVLGYASGGDESGAPTQLITIPPSATNVSIGQNGAVTYTDENSADTDSYGQTVTAGYLALASFPNAAGLTRSTESDWTYSDNSGSPQYGTAGAGKFNATTVLSGELEQSNVDMATEFSNMIEAERGYQANTSVMSTVDSMVQTLIQTAAA